MGRKYKIVVASLAVICCCLSKLMTSVCMCGTNRQSMTHIGCWTGRSIEVQVHPRCCMHVSKIKMRAVYTEAFPCLTT